jgi:hypothetical protein
VIASDIGSLGASFGFGDQLFADTQRWPLGAPKAKPPDCPVRQVFETYDLFDVATASEQLSAGVLCGNCQLSRIQRAGLRDSVGGIAHVLEEGVIEIAKPTAGCGISTDAAHRPVGRRATLARREGFGGVTGG